VGALAEGGQGNVCRHREGGGRARAVGGFVRGKKKGRRGGRAVVSWVLAGTLATCRDGNGSVYQGEVQSGPPGSHELSNRLTFSAITWGEDLALEKKKVCKRKGVGKGSRTA